MIAEQVKPYAYARSSRSTGCQNKNDKKASFNGFPTKQTIVAKQVHNNSVIDGKSYHARNVTDQELEALDLFCSGISLEDVLNEIDATRKADVLSNTKETINAVLKKICSGDAQAKTEFKKQLCNDAFAFVSPKEDVAKENFHQYMCYLKALSAQGITESEEGQKAQVELLNCALEQLRNQFDFLTDDIKTKCISYAYASEMMDEFLTKIPEGVKLDIVKSLRDLSATQTFKQTIGQMEMIASNGGTSDPNGRAPKKSAAEEASTTEDIFDSKQYLEEQRISREKAHAYARETKKILDDIDKLLSVPPSAEVLDEGKKSSKTLKKLPETQQITRQILATPKTNTMPATPKANTIPATPKANTIPATPKANTIPAKPQLPAQSKAEVKPQEVKPKPQVSEQSAKPYLSVLQISKLPTITAKYDAINTLLDHCQDDAELTSLHSLLVSMNRAELKEQSKQPMTQTQAIAEQSKRFAVISAAEKVVKPAKQAIEVIAVHDKKPADMNHIIDSLLALSIEPLVLGSSAEGHKTDPKQWRKQDIDRAYQAIKRQFSEAQRTLIEKHMLDILRVLRLNHYPFGWEHDPKQDLTIHDEVFETICWSFYSRFVGESIFDKPTYQYIKRLPATQKLKVMQGLFGSQVTSNIKKSIESGKEKRPNFNLKNDGRIRGKVEHASKLQLAIFRHHNGSYHLLVGNTGKMPSAIAINKKELLHQVLDHTKGTYFIFQAAGMKMPTSKQNYQLVM